MQVPGFDAVAFDCHLTDPPEEDTHCEDCLDTDTCDRDPHECAEERAQDAADHRADAEGDR
jgi:hypothetical protein